MKCFVGTSGWSYAWNSGRNLRWYVENTPFNTVELNASFYRFPFKNYVKSWRKTAEAGLRFSVKAHRLITHTYRFSEKAFDVWKRFKELFRELDEFIDFYLFQLPPSTKPNIENKLRKFIDFTGLGARFALEFRNKEWYTMEPERVFNDITLVSVSTPNLSKKIFNTSSKVYLRFHGREQWYRYTYSREELIGFINRVDAAKPDLSYFYFNNDTGMFENALMMAEICNLK